MASKRPGALWATEEADEQKRLPMPVAIGVAAAITVGAVVGLSFVDFDQVMAEAKRITRATIVENEPPPPPPPPPKEEPPPPKPVQKIVKAPPTPVPTPPRPDPTPPPPSANIAAAEKPAPTAPAIATPAATGPATAPMVSAPPAPPAPPAKAHGTGGPVEIGLVCPRQVKPEIPRRLLQLGLSGNFVVKALITVKGGKVTDVNIVRADRPELRNAVISAVKQYDCQTNGDDEVVGQQEFEFRLE
ncbi:energy transducer TonB [Derxia gummosa]|uniref:Energy transducer TonB n=1 Tax=Derxia gummosa DSM 723 TaxID=1121388 RepID=A0A8B6X6P1_9BURK|nr:hypothetical protein [Derxia gummosa]